MKRLFCRWFHNDLAYPGGETMWCRTCYTRWDVPWAPLTGDRIVNRPILLYVHRPLHEDTEAPCPQS